MDQWITVEKRFSSSYSKRLWKLKLESLPEGLDKSVDNGFRGFTEGKLRKLILNLHPQRPMAGWHWQNSATTIFLRKHWSGPIHSYALTMSNQVPLLSRRSYCHITGILYPVGILSANIAAIILVLTIHILDFPYLICSPAHFGCIFLMLITSKSKERSRNTNDTIPLSSNPFGQRTEVDGPRWAFSFPWLHNHS